MNVPRLTPREIERRAAAFNRTYGVTTFWPDEKIERALADHGLPSLSEMPDRDTSSAARKSTSYGVGWSLRGPIENIASPVERYRWKRTNAMHLLGHAIAEHSEEVKKACGACFDWFTPAEAPTP